MITLARIGVSNPYLLEKGDSNTQEAVYRTSRISNSIAILVFSLLDSFFFFEGIPNTRRGEFWNAGWIVERREDQRY